MAKIKTDEQLLKVLQEIFPHDEIEKDQIEGKGFWIYLKAVSRFTLDLLPSNVGCVCVPASLPFENIHELRIACWFNIINY